MKFLGKEQEFPCVLVKLLFQGRSWSPLGMGKLLFWVLTSLEELITHFKKNLSYFRKVWKFPYPGNLIKQFSLSMENNIKQLVLLHQ